MAYDPSEADALDRIRGRAGDTSDPPLLIGGEERYEAIIARHPDTGIAVAIDGLAMDVGEAQATAEALDALASQLRLEAKSLSSAGESLSYEDRAAGLAALAARYRTAALHALTPPTMPSYALVGSGTVDVRVRW